VVIGSAITNKFHWSLIARGAFIRRTLSLPNSFCTGAGRRTKADKCPMGSRRQAKLMEAICQ
jgi:hypothetical protein